MLTPVLTIMIKWSFPTLITSFPICTFLTFVVLWMELKLFPSMTMPTYNLVRSSAFFVSRYEASVFPLRTRCIRILHNVWLPSKVLRIVCVNTLRSIMFRNIWAPYSFKIINIEILRPGKMVYQLSVNLILAVCKTAVFSIFALIQIVGKK